MRKLFKEAWGILKNIKTLAIAAVFYALIFAAAFGISKLAALSLLQNKQAVSPVLGILFFIVYFLIVVFVYSFFKIGIIEIAAKNKIAKKSFEKLGGFFLFNLVVSVLAFIVVSLLGAVITYSFSNTIVAGTIFLVIFLDFFLPLLVFSQFEFIQTGKIFRSLGNGWKILFSGKIWSYFKLLLFDLIVSAVFLAAYALLFYGIGQIYKIAFIDNNANAAFYTSLYNNVIFQIPLAVFFLLLLSANFLLLKKIKG